MADMNQSQLLDLVNSTKINEGTPRVREITRRIVSDLFRTIDDFNVTPDEFWAAAQWLTRLGATGQVGLITAGLGFDRLLDIRSDEADRAVGRETGTPRAIEGPLYIPGAPLSKFEVRLDTGEEAGEALVVEGQVLNTEGNPVSGAIVDVWHCNDKGRYSHFDPDQKEYNLRRRIETEVNGRYRFRSFIPPGYSIPPNSPTSELFELLGRHGQRPAHIHFLVVAQELRTLTTQINIPGDTFIDDDFAFATRDGLVVDLERKVPPKGYESLGLTEPFTRVKFDFLLPKANNAQEAAPEARYQRVLK